LKKIETNPAAAEFDRIEMKKFYPEQYFKRAGYNYETVSNNKEIPLKKHIASALQKSRNIHMTKDFVRFNEELDSI
jgi:hypothetical protein